MRIIKFCSFLNNERIQKKGSLRRVVRGNRLYACFAWSYIIENSGAQTVFLHVIVRFSSCLCFGLTGTFIQCLRPISNTNLETARSKASSVRFECFMARSVFPAESVLSLTNSHSAFAPLKGKHLAYVCSMQSSSWTSEFQYLMGNWRARTSMLIDNQRAQFSMFLCSTRSMRS